MASHDPMGLGVRSQAFYRDFYHFHKGSCDAWYIKDENHHYLDASISFLSRFLTSPSYLIIGQTDRSVSVSSDSNIEIMHYFEQQIITGKKGFSLLTLDYFCDHNGVRCFILKMKPFRKSNDRGVIVYVYDLAKINKNLNWLSALTECKLQPSDQCEGDLMPVKNPLTYMTSKEWEVVWLLTCGCTVNGVAAFLNISSRSVEYKLSRVYMKLQVFSKNKLILLAEKWRWVDFITKRFISQKTIFCLPPSG